MKALNSSLTVKSESISTFHNITCSLIVLYAFFLPISIAISNPLLYSILLLWLVDKDLSSRLRFYLSYPLTLPILAFLGITFLGTLYSAGNLSTCFHVFKEVFRLMFIPLLAYYLQDELHNPKKKYVLYAFVGSLIFTIIAACLKVYADIPIGHRTTGNDVFKNHIVTSYFIAITLFFLTIWLFDAKKNKFLLIALISLVLYFLVFLNTGRVGYIFLYVCFTVLAYHRFGMKGLTIALIGISGFLLLAYQYSDTFQQRIDNFYSEIVLYLQGTENTGVGNRLQYITISMDMFLKEPLFGFGTGSFKEIFQTAYYSAHTKLTDNPHNQYLFIAAELGIMGLSAFFWLLYKHWKLITALQGETKIIAQALFLSFIIGCIFNSWIKNTTECCFYCLMTAYFLPIQFRKSTLMQN